MTNEQAKRVKDIRGKFAVSQLKFGVASWLDVEWLLQLVDDLCGQLKEEMAEYATALKEHTVQLTVQVANARREDAADLRAKADFIDHQGHEDDCCYCGETVIDEYVEALEAKAKEEAGG